ncbi:PH domain-containing protein [Rummeliibacillus sp. TYF005]|uniref:PH domain-containing protein n=1 Tax=Rummeliibacillus sp. TYF005 TaxID=2058214 RepID=UPI000F52AF0C|nr:PH domain-containing protein [Rummeliibacillus sp. TYF005]RPJ94240.1 PH domain-containing protein [Rummeliibacillus sp. TYF005]
MGLFDNLMGNATEVSKEIIHSEIKDLIAKNEKVEQAYKLIRDLFVFTDKRLILIDKQGVTGKKIEYHSIPYRSVVHFSIETAGTFDFEAELKIWLSNSDEPIEKRFTKQSDIYKIQSVLAAYVLKE